MPAPPEGEQRSILSRLLAPLALVSALLLPINAHWPTASQGRLVEALGRNSDLMVLTHLSSRRASARSRLSEEEALLLFGDEEDGKPGSRWRRLLELHPEDPVLFGAHMSDVIASQDDGRAALFQAAREREPNNARYDWALAWELCQEAAAFESPGERPGGSGGGVEKAKRYVVHDRARLDKAMSLVLSGAEKPYFRRYAQELLARQMDVFGQARGITESIERLSIAASMLLPDISVVRGLAKHTLAYARLLAEEGKSEEAARYVQLWQDLAEGLEEDAFTLVDALVVSAITGIAEEQAPAVLSSLGLEEVAERNRQYAAAWSAPLKAWREGQEGFPRHRFAKKAGIMDSMLLPAFGGGIEDAELRAGRLLDYHLLDTAVVLHLPLVAALFVGLLWLIGLRWRVGGEAPHQTLLLSPSLPRQIRIVLFGFLLPAVLWLAATRFPPTGGREFSIMATLPRAPAQLLVTAAIMLATTGWLAMRAVRARCGAVGMAVPQRRAIPGRVLASLLAVAAVLAFFPMPQDLERTTGTATLSLAVLAIVVLSGAILGLVVLCRWLGDKNHGAYYGTMARSVIPSYALFILLLVWLPLIPMKLEEQRLVNNSTWGAQAEGFTTIEDRVVQKLLAQLREAAEPWR